MPEKEFDGKKPGRNVKKILLLGLAAIVVLGVLATVAMHLTSNPNFCSTCHQIQPRVEAWSKGPHKDVECLDCHAKPGTLGYVVRKVSSMKEVYLQLTNQVPAELHAVPHPESCIYCHTGKNSKYPKAKNITLTSGDLAPSMSHADILKSNISCLTCHKYVGHGEE